MSFSDFSRCANPEGTVFLLSLSLPTTRRDYIFTPITIFSQKGLLFRVP